MLSQIITVHWQVDTQGSAIDGEFNKHLSAIEIEDLRDLELDKFIKIGKKRILNNLDFCGFTLSDFVTFYSTEYHDGRALDALVRFIALLHIPAASPSTTIKSPNPAFLLIGYQQFLLDALDLFVQSKISAVKTAFELSLDEEI